MTDVSALPGDFDDAAFGGVCAPQGARALSYLEPAFDLAESAVELYDLTEVERDAIAGIGLQPSGFHPIMAPALPEGPETADDDKAEPVRQPRGRGFAQRIAAFQEGPAYARLRQHGWQIAAVIGIGAAVIGIPAGYSAGVNSAAGESGGALVSTVIDAVHDAKSQVAEPPEAESTGKGQAAGAAAPEASALQGKAADGKAAASTEADRIPAEEITPITVDPVAAVPEAELARLASVDVSPGTSRQLEVPVVNQMDDSEGGRSLWAGCEVASLAMVLRHAGIEVTKEELQDLTPTVPLVGPDGLYGNPNRAFVGEMDGDESGFGYSVYHGPIAELAQRYTLNRPLKTVDLTGQSFTTVLKEVADGNPCWIITTTSMTPETMPETWQTAEGTVEINWALHSVVVTGFDDESVYINDPYSYSPNTGYNRDDFERAWKLMGSQAVAVVPAG